MRKKNAPQNTDSRPFDLSFTSGSEDEMVMEEDLFEVPVHAIDVTYLQKSSNPFEDIRTYLADSVHTRICKNWEACANLFSKSTSKMVYGHRFYWNRNEALIDWRQNPKSQDRPFFITRDSTNSKTNGKLHTYFDSPKEYSDWREQNCAPHERCDYEVFFRGQEIRFYLDFDLSKDKFSDFFLNNDATTRLNMVYDLIRIVLCIGAQLLGIPMVQHDTMDSILEHFTIFTSHDPETKYSIHVITKCLYTNSSSKVHQWILDVKKKLNGVNNIDKKFIDAIDEATYGKSQNFRLAGSTKFGKNRTKVPFNNTNTTTNTNIDITDYLVQISFKKPIDALYVEYAEYKKTQKRVKGSRSKHITTTTTTNNDLSITTHHDGDNDSVYPFLNGFEKTIGYHGVLHFIQQLGLIPTAENNKMMPLQNQGGYECPTHRRRHDHDNPYIYVSGNWYIFDCRRCTDAEKEQGIGPCVIGMTCGHPTDMDDKVLEEELKRILPIGLYANDNENYSYIGPNTTVFRRNTQYLENLKDLFLYGIEEKTLVISSPLGSGKTRASAEIFYEFISNNPNKRILVLTSRITYADTIGPRLEDAIKNITNRNDFVLNSDLYRNCTPEQRRKSKFLIIQMESLHHLIDPDTNEISTFDLVIGDEICAVLKQFTSIETQRKSLARNAKVFEHVMTNAQKVLLMDGFVTPLVFEVLQEMKMPYAFYLNTYQNDRGEAIEICSKKKFSDQMIYDVTQHKKHVFFPTASKDFGRTVLETYKNELKNYNCLYLNRDTDDQLKSEASKYVNQMWKRDLLIISPTITVGMDFSDKEHFDRKYLHGNCYSIDVATTCQMLERVRHIKEKKLYFYNEVRKSESSYALCTMEALESVYSLKMEYLNKLKDAQGIPLAFTWQEGPLWLKKIYMYTQLERQLCQNYYSIIFYRHSSLLGYTIKSPAQIELLYPKKVLVKKTTPYDSIPDVLSMTTSQIEELESKIQILRASEMDKLTFKKLLFHKYVKAEGNYKQVFESFSWIHNSYNAQAIVRLGLYKKQTSTKDLIEMDIYCGNFYLNSNVEITYLSEIRWIGEQLGLKHPHDTETHIKKSTLERMFDTQLDRCNTQSKLFEVDPIITQANPSSKKDKKLGTKSERMVDFLNRILKQYFLCELKMHTKRKRRIQDGQRVDITPYLILVDEPFYDILQ
jgi:hypothetical protein